MTGRRSRLGFRTRLTVTITLVFVLAGGALLAGQYFVVEHLFASASEATGIMCGPLGGGEVATESDPVHASAVPEDPAAAPASASGCVTIETQSLDAETRTMSARSTPSPTSGPGATSFDLQVGAAEAVIRQTQFLSDEVVGGLLWWSVGLLVGFAAIAWAIASWLARRSLGRIGEVTAAARDISEHDLGRRLDLPGPDDEVKELGDTFDSMLDRLQSAFAAQDRFVANASHELRTPLTTTRLALEIPLSQGDVPADLEPTIRAALRATQQSERLISGLLTLSRGSIDPDGFEPVGLEAVVQAEIDEIADAVAERGIALTTALEPVTVRGDATLLARAVRNLLDNAIRHNVAGGRIEVRLSSSCLEVENTGAVLDPETVDLLIEPFSRGAGSRISEGMGLGLSIVESIALAHEGELRLAARAGGGLIATLRLPTLPGG